MWGIVRHFDFGTSLTYPGQSVNAIIARSLPISATVGLLAYLLALIVGITMGTIAALKPNSRWDYASMGLAMLGNLNSQFRVLGRSSSLVFSLTLYWLPPSRWEGFPSSNIILPVITLVGDFTWLHCAADAGRNARGAEVRLHPHCARERLERKTGRNCDMRCAADLMPVVSYTGPALAFLLTGTVVVERIFILPGLGNYFIQASLNRDEPLIIGIVAFIAIVSC